MVPLFELSSLSFHGKLREDRSQELSWYADRTITSPKDRVHVADLIRDLAFKIYYDVEQDGRPPCKTWEALAHYTDALAYWLHYFATRSIDSLQAATTSCKQVLTTEPSSLSALPLLVILANEHLRQGQYDTASDLYQTLVELQSKGEKSKLATAWMLFGVAEDLAGRHLSAERNYRLALMEDPALELAWRNLAYLLIQLAREREAAIAVHQVAKCSKIESHLDLGDLFMDFNLIAVAEAHYRMALDNNRDDVRALVKLGDLLTDTNQRNEAIALYEAALRVSPDRAKTYNSLGIAFAESGRQEDAIQQYLRASSLDPQYAAPYLNLGKIYLKKNDPEAARIEFLKAVAAQPSMGTAFYHLGFVLQDLKRFKEAEEALLMGLRLGPNGPEVHERLGGVYSSQGQTEKAIAEYKKAIDLAPEWSSPWVSLGFLYHDSNRLEEAKAALQSALRLGADQANVHEILGEVYESQGEIQRAISEFKKAIDLTPQSFEPYLRLGYLYRDCGALDDALQQLRIARDKDPEQRDIYHGAGGVFRRMNRLSDAIDQYNVAIKLDSRDAYAHMELAVIYGLTDKPDLSSQHRKMALELGDDEIEGEYNRACFWALAGNIERSLQFLSEAIAANDEGRGMASKDVDFDSVRDDPGFQALVTGSLPTQATQTSFTSKAKGAVVAGR
jgi:tetratricopeptide (TPR) repeat protein